MMKTWTLVLALLLVGVASCGNSAWEAELVALYEDGTLDRMGEFGEVDRPIRSVDDARVEIETACAEMEPENVERAVSILGQDLLRQSVIDDLGSAIWEGSSAEEIRSVAALVDSAYSDVCSENYENFLEVVGIDSFEAVAP